MPGLLFGYGASSFLWILIVVIVGVVLWRGRTKYVTGTTIVVTHFEINENPSRGPLLAMKGRVSGLVSWVLTLLRLSPEVEFVVTDQEVTLKTASLSGLQHTYIPLAKVTATVCGYQRSIIAFALAALFTLGCVFNLISGFLGSNRNEVGSDMGLAFGFLVLAAIAALFYYLSKRISIAFESMHVHGLAFKQAVIGNVSVGLQQALQAIAVINARILAAQTVQTMPVGDESGPAARAAAVPLTTRCSQCGGENPSGTRFCESCGAAFGR